MGNSVARHTLSLVGPPMCGGSHRVQTTQCHAIVPVAADQSWLSFLAPGALGETSAFSGMLAPSCVCVGIADSSIMPPSASSEQARTSQPPRELVERFGWPGDAKKIAHNLAAPISSFRNATRPVKVSTHCSGIDTPVWAARVVEKFSNVKFHEAVRWRQAPQPRPDLRPHTGAGHGGEPRGRGLCHRRLYTRTPGAPVRLQRVRLEAPRGRAARRRQGFPRPDRRGARDRAAARAPRGWPRQGARSTLDVQQLLLSNRFRALSPLRVF